MIVSCSKAYHFKKFQENLSTTFQIIQMTNKPTNKQTNKDNDITFSAEIKTREANEAKD